MTIKNINLYECSWCKRVIKDPYDQCTHYVIGNRTKLSDTETMLRNVVDFAYIHGYHEHGIDLVTTFKEEIRNE